MLGKTFYPTHCGGRDEWTTEMPLTCDSVIDRSSPVTVCCFPMRQLCVFHEKHGIDSQHPMGLT
jgi:hypothetical protein